MALTITMDKLMVGDFYEDDPRNAWFISSFFGTIMGLSATAVAWIMVSEAQTANVFISLFGGTTCFYALGMIAIGTLVSLNLKVYFDMLSCHAYTTRVAIAIAATPVFVFAAQSLINGVQWGSAAIFSVLLTTFALAGFEAISVTEDKRPDCNFNWQLIAFIVTSTIYLVLLDWLFGVVENKTSLDGIQSSLVMMPFYWIGYAIGTISIFRKSVQVFLRKIFSRWRFLLVALALEVIGTSFYLFEFVGIAEIDATLVSLVVGAHIVFVWMFDIYLRGKYKTALAYHKEYTRIFFFKVETADLSAYDLSLKALALQGVFIILAIIGITMWPSL
jgi:hypothetical protein